jgi:hypothetical protein
MHVTVLCSFVVLVLEEETLLSSFASFQGRNSFLSPSQTVIPSMQLTTNNTDTSLSADIVISYT